MRVVTLCGSLHSGSTNAAVLGVVAERLATRGIEVEPAEIDGELPSFRPRQADDPPAPIGRLRAQFDRADGIVIAVPEYAGGAPGWVKNITDWMVESASLHGRVAAVMSAATSGGTHAVEQVARTLTWQGAHVVATCRVAAPLTKIGDDHVVSDESTVAELHRVADALADALAGTTDVDAATAETLARLGIERFPDEGDG